MEVLEFDRKVYCVEATQAAAYRFIDRLTVVISTTEASIRCEVEAVSGRTVDLANVVADFKRELLDQQLRQRLRTENQEVRNLILSLAFSRTGLQS